jgi:3-phytase
MPCTIYRLSCLLIYTFLLIAMPARAENAASEQSSGAKSIRPVFVTEPTPHDTDDPAIWIHPTDPEQSLIVGTDKTENGGLYVFNLKGKMLREKTVTPLRRPNNVDIEYGLQLAGRQVDIAVATERLTRKLRVYTLPAMTAIDDGGLEIFADESGEQGAPMGIALYKRPEDGAIFAIVSRKTGPIDNYLWQYLLHDDGTGRLRATLVRKFGTFSGKKEIEAIAVDDTLGYVYYSDEGVGVRKYYADPGKGGQELALFALVGFREDREGISIYRKDASTGYLMVSDQAANTFHIFPREGMPGNPHHHPLLKTVKLMTNASDGSEVTSVPLGATFSQGMFVAMSDDRTFHYYRWKDLAGAVPGPRLSYANGQ